MHARKIKIESYYKRLWLLLAGLLLSLSAEYSADNVVVGSQIKLDNHKNTKKNKQRQGYKSKSSSEPAKAEFALHGTQRMIMTKKMKDRKEVRCAVHASLPRLFGSLKTISVRSEKY
jgi:hypothetical protein